MAGIIDLIDKMGDSLGGSLDKLAPAGQNFAQMAGRSAPQRVDWGALLSGAGGGATTDWTSRVLGGYKGGLSWTNVAADGRIDSSYDLSGYDNYKTIQGQRIGRENAQLAQTGTQSTGRTLTETFSGPATSDDNKALTAQQIDNWIATTRGNSPLNGQGAYILQVANQYGVSVPLMLGIFLKETELGTTSGPNKNLSGIVAPTDQGLGTVRQFNGYATWQESIAATAANLATPIYKGKSLQEQLGSWYVGPQEWAAKGLAATDKAGNGTVGDYVNMVAQVYAQLGVTAQPGQGGTRAPVNAQGTAFPVQAYKGQIALHWGTDQGAADIFAAAGTPVAAMRGGKVIDAGWSDIGGWNVTIQGEDGLTYYYAHMQNQPSVRAGQTVAGGTIFGAVGDTGNAKGTGAHLHLGIGYGINSGTGPQGGSGINFNATEYLQRALGLPVSSAAGSGQYTP